MKSGGVVWFTGLPSSGKSTLARRVAARLRRDGAAVVVLDGDDVRAALAPTPAYGAEARDDFYLTLARLAAHVAAQDVIVLVAATAHLSRYRARARSLSPRFVEVFVDTPLEICSARDDKGLYAAAERGDAPELPGGALGYERPTAPEVTIATDTVDPVDAVTRAVVARASAPG